MKRILFILVIIFLFLQLNQLEIAEARLKDDYNILVIHSYHPSMSWTRDINRGLEDSLARQNINYEYLYSKDYQSNDYFDRIFQLYSYKYAEKEFELVIVADNNALNFYFDYANLLFSETPVVFNGINYFRPEMIAGRDNITGVVENVDFQKNIDLILKLHPETERIIVYGDDTETFQLNKIKLKRLQENYSEIDIIIHDQLLLDEVLEDVSQLGQGDIIFLASTIKDNQGQVMAYSIIPEILANESQVPIYGVWDFFLGRGIVGGMLTSGYYQGQLAGEMALQIMAKKESAQLPAIEDSPNHYMFDYEQLNKFAINLSALPEDSLIINEELSFWEENKIFLISLVIFFIILSLIILILFYHNIKLTKVKNKLALEKKTRKDIIDTAQALIIIIDAEFKIKDFNNYAQQISAYSKEEVLDKNIKQVFGLENNIKLLEYFQSENQILNKVDEKKLISWGISEVYNGAKRKSFFLITGVDITEERRMEKRLSYSEQHDLLTGLYNLDFIKKTFKENKKIAKESKRHIIVFSLDIDRFKLVNNAYGHKVGDELLVRSADRLKDNLNKNVILGRIGADNFIGLKPNIKNLDKALTNLIKGVFRSFKEPFLIQGKEFFANISLGLSIYPETAYGIDILLQNADNATLIAKKEAGNSFQVYNKGLDFEIDKSLGMENELHQAIDNNQLEVYYQPIMDVDGKEIKKAEALVRWSHPERGLISPGDFIPLAEETGLIVPLGREVLKTVCRDLKSWQEKGYQDIEITINLSPQQFLNKGLIRDIKNVLEQFELNPEVIGLEITETAAITNFELSKSIIKEIKKMRIKVLLDDFGVGYSSLKYLTNFNVDTIKIDRSFIMEVINDQKKAAVVSSLISLAHDLGMDIVAEGVETKEELAFLNENNCDLIQGYYFNPPLPVGEFVKLIN